MKNIIFLILVFCLSYSISNGQISTSNYSYTVLQNDFGLKVCKGVFELNENLLLFDDHKIVIYNNDYAVIATVELESGQSIEAISTHYNLIYCAVSEEDQFTVKAYDSSLNELSSKNLDFNFSDFEKTSNGYFFYNSKLNESDQTILFSTDNDFVRNKSFFQTPADDRNLIIATTSKMVKKDSESIYFNIPGTGEIYQIHECGEQSLIYNMGTDPGNPIDDEEMGLSTIKKLQKDAPILMYSINENYLVFFSQKNGSYIYYYDRSNNDLKSRHASIKYDSMDKFDFTGTYPSTFLKQRNKFAALVKGSDIHLIKDVVTPSSKTNHIPNCDESDIILMTFDVKS